MYIAALSLRVRVLRLCVKRVHRYGNMSLLSEFLLSTRDSCTTSSQEYTCVCVPARLKNERAVYRVFKRHVDTVATVIIVIIISNHNNSPV